MINAESVMQELEQVVYQAAFLTHGEKIAGACSSALFDCLWLNFRTQYLYVPTSDRQALDGRNLAMWQEFTGKNYQELAVKYRLSAQQVYAIIKKMRLMYSDRSGKLAKDKPLLLWVIDEYLKADFVRCGLSAQEAETIAQNVAAYLCKHFPGVSIRITDANKAARQQGKQLTV